MYPAIRQQTDIVDQDIVSLEAGLDCSTEPDTARQEFKREADVNYILSRFAVDGVLPSKQVSYGEVDWDLDLHGAYIALEAVDVARRSLSPALQRKYRSQKELLDAMNSGELEADLRAEKVAAQVKPASADAADQEVAK